MAGFDAATAVDPMDWDFSKYEGGTGTVPEPSTNEMKAFQKEFAKIMRKGAALDIDDDDALKMSEKEFVAFQKKADAIGEELDVAVARLCKNQPSEEQMAKLPFRVKTQFSKWLMAEMNPEGEAAGTKK